jgi:hypothetical protein
MRSTTQRCFPRPEPCARFGRGVAARPAARTAALAPDGAEWHRPAAAARGCRCRWRRRQVLPRDPICRTIFSLGALSGERLRTGAPASVRPSRRPAMPAPPSGRRTSECSARAAVAAGIVEHVSGETVWGWLSRSGRPGTRLARGGQRLLQRELEAAYWRCGPRVATTSPSRSLRHAEVVLAIGARS